MCKDRGGVIRTGEESSGLGRSHQDWGGVIGDRGGVIRIGEESSGIGEWWGGS